MIRHATSSRTKVRNHKPRRRAGRQFKPGRKFLMKLSEDVARYLIRQKALHLKAFTATVEEAVRLKIQSESEARKNAGAP